MSIVSSSLSRFSLRSLCVCSIVHIARKNSGLWQNAGGSASDKRHTLSSALRGRCSFGMAYPVDLCDCQEDETRLEYLLLNRQVAYSTCSHPLQIPHRATNPVTPQIYFDVVRVAQEWEPDRRECTVHPHQFLHVRSTLVRLECVQVLTVREPRLMNHQTFADCECRR